jgi:hypothetical protein
VPVGKNMDEDIVDAFNDFFTNIADELTKNVGASKKVAMEYLRHHPRLENTFKFKLLSVHDIVEITKNLKISNTQDLWFLSSNILKYIIIEIAPMLSQIFNECLTQGVFPDLLKMAKLIPIYKKGDKSNPTNYRPISILPVFSKILEKVVSEQLTKFLTDNDVLHSQQHGFRKNRSTGHAIASLTENILRVFEEGHDACGIFCDLSKAFDCVEHDVLIGKLEHYGIRGSEIRFFASYLSQRQQITEINGARSKMGKVKHGVPQGSILGPLLFLIYINDLPNSVRGKCDVIMYADDTSLLIKGNKYDERLAENVVKILDDVNQWFDANNLVLNMTKTNAICFSLKGNKNILANQLLENNALHVINSYKFLGVVMDEKLRWSPHVDLLCGRLGSAIYAIKKIKDLCGVKTARNVYFAYFHSVMVYGVMVWGGERISQE